MHDPFPTPFTDEVLDNVGGQEVYSFTYGFSGYHQIRIHEETEHQLVQEKYTVTKLEKMINDVCVEFPHCNIPVDAGLPQKVRIIVSKAKDVEETIEKVDVEHKGRIAEFKVKTLGTPLTEKEVQAQALKGYVGIVEVHIKEAHKLINDVGEAWINMEDIDNLVNVRAQLQAMQREVDTFTNILEDLQPIQRMLKMGESTKL